MSDYDSQTGRLVPADPARDSAELHADQDDLRQGLTGLAGLVADSRGFEELLGQIAVFANHAIPKVDGVGVSMVGVPGGSRYVQSREVTADFVLEIDRLQYQVLGEGPCITCMQTGRPVLSGSLGSDERWPRFGGRVARLGVHSSLSVPLIVDDDVIGAVNCYAHVRDAFSEHAVVFAGHFVGPASVAVHNARLLTAARAKAEQLQTALLSRAVIDQAIGIIRSRSGGTAEEATARLKQISQAENVKLAVVAQRLVDEAVRRAHARRSTT
ncbi:GAF and ANTAR domain-containing protein [uncultured Jatrophihabitans sp.]|uniref:GAF and ANTAR domain-containing protein n=1 Tax=uncultured Jatrophihabitans sp. TaxID=1610747 RepID=UPI0035CAC599